MAIDFRRTTITFDPTSGREQRESATVVFNSNVRRAEAALKGFSIGYNNGDHELLRETIDVDVASINNNTVTVAVDFLLRDSSGNIDDPYSGFAEVLVLADVA
jgi:hypothetical protein